MDTGITVGLLEGEGCISIRWQEFGAPVGVSSNSYGCKVVLQPIISISNTDSDIMEYTGNIMEGSMGTPKLKHRKENWKDVHQWCLNNMERVINFLRWLQPYLISEKKKRLCELVIEFCKIRLSCRGMQGAHTQREIDIFEEVANINTSRGKRRKPRNLQLHNGYIINVKKLKLRA